VELADAMRNRSSTQPPVERLIALGYGLTYDAVVRGFPPYEALLAEVAGLVARAATPGPPAATRVLDVSCGTGTLAARLAREGWTVVGVDSVAHLVEVGRRYHSDSGLSLSFHHQAIDELCRVAYEVRIFPLLTYNAEPCPFVDSVTNTRPSEGGEDAESLDDAKARAPLEIRSRSRAGFSHGARRLDLPRLQPLPRSLSRPARPSDGG